MAGAGMAPAFQAILDTAARTHVLHLTDMSLAQVPAAVWTMTGLVRLDLGGNSLATLPAELGKLTKLEELWVNDNPLASVPPEIEQCRKLRVVDLRNTRLTTLPREMARLRNIIEVDLRGAPLQPQLLSAYGSECDTDALMTALKTVDTQTELRLKLERRLRDTVYREVADSKEGTAGILELVDSVFRVFTDIDELKSVIRNCERLFPEDLGTANARAIKRTFTTLKRENQMKKLAAEVELKLRAIYFNVIRPERVEGIVKSIYEEITTLNDIRFLLFYATKLFPPTPAELTAKGLKQAIVDLRRQFAEEREAAIKGIETALKGMYTDQEPEKIRRLADDVAALFKRVEDLKKIGADAGMYFPTEFSSVKPHRVQRKYLQVQEQQAREEAGEMM